MGWSTKIRRNYPKSSGLKRIPMEMETSLWHSQDFQCLHMPLHKNWSNEKMISFRETFLLTKRFVYNFILCHNPFFLMIWAKKYLGIVKRLICTSIRLPIRIDFHWYWFYYWLTWSNDLTFQDIWLFIPCFIHLRFFLYFIEKWKSISNRKQILRIWIGHHKEVWRLEFEWCG